MANGVIQTIPILTNNFKNIPLYRYNFQGEIPSTWKYRICRNIFEFGGTARISVTSRTGSNPGVRFFIPENRKLTTTFSLPAGFPSSTTYHGYEMLNITADSVTEMRITTTETLENLSPGNISFNIPWIGFALQPL